MLSRIVTIALVVPALLFAGALPAKADPAGPTNYRATVTGVTPEDATVDVEVHGGDSYLVLRPPPGVETIVPGYEAPDQYLRFAGDGTVYVNLRSPTHYLNQERYGAPIPASADPEATPEWQQVATGGTYGWHDHRIHWMSPSTPPQVDASAGTTQPVFDWEVPLVVDGQPVTVVGELIWLPSPTPALATGIAVLLAVLVAVAGRRRPVAVGAAATGVAAAALVGVNAAGNWGLPAGVEGSYEALMPAGVALIGAVLVLGMRARPGGERRLLAGLAAISLGIACLIDAGVLARPVLPTPLPAPLVRSVVAGALGTAFGVLAALALRLGRRSGDAATPEETSVGRS